MFHYTIETNAGIDKAVAAMEAALKERKFGVLWQLNLHDKLQEKGFAFGRRFVVLEVCDPAEAVQVLNESVMAGYFLPCKIVVYEDGGKTKIGMAKPTLFMRHLAENERLLRIAAEVEARLTAAIDSAGAALQE